MTRSNAEAVRAAVEAAIEENAREARAFRWVALAMLLLTIGAGAVFALTGFSIWLLLLTAVFMMATCVSVMIGLTA